MKFSIDSNIKKATTLSTDFYTSSEAWELAKEKIFSRTWQFSGDKELIFNGFENVHPYLLINNYLEEPLLLIKSNEGEIKCLSNVCTHRGFLLVNQPAKLNKIVCGYHGRRFTIDGKFEHMPEFTEADDFPRPCDNLPEVPFGYWQRFLFTAIDPTVSFDGFLGMLNKWVGFMDLSQYRYAPEYSKTYNVHAHWALYCDNYLEGFHIPFVHDDFMKILDYGKYKTLTQDEVVLQVGYGDKDSFVFDLPEDHPEYGEHITAFYFWVFPNFMLNIYPWGVQLNIVKPINTGFCKVEFLYYIVNQEIFDIMNGEKLADKVEQEDEFVVEAVQKGLRSHFYKNGRFSPTQENGVHYFHQLIAKYMNA